MSTAICTCGAPATFVAPSRLLLCGRPRGGFLMRATCRLQRQQPPRQPSLLVAAAAAGSEPEQRSHHVADPLLESSALPGESQLWPKIQLLATRAYNLERSGASPDQVADMLLQALHQLESTHGPIFALVPLRQLLWDALRAAGRQTEALEQALAVHTVVGVQFGANSAEQHLVGVRLGISEAACGQLDVGMQRIYEATPVLQHNLGLLLQQVQQVAAAPQPGEAGASSAEAVVEELQALQGGIDKLAAALGEGNFYGSLFTLQHASARGLQDGVVKGWEELEDIVDSGFGSIVVAAATAEGGGGIVEGALQEHDRLTRQLSSDAMLAKLIQRQNERLHSIAEQGLEHPLFRQDDVDD